MREKKCYYHTFSLIFNGRGMSYSILIAIDMIVINLVPSFIEIVDIIW